MFSRPYWSSRRAGRARDFRKYATVDVATAVDWSISWKLTRVICWRRERVSARTGGGAWSYQRPGANLVPAVAKLAGTRRVWGRLRKCWPSWRHGPAGMMKGYIVVAHTGAGALRPMMDGRSGFNRRRVVRRGFPPTAHDACAHAGSVGVGSYAPTFDLCSSARALLRTLRFDVLASAFNHRAEGCTRGSGGRVDPTPGWGWDEHQIAKWTRRCRLRRRSFRRSAEADSATL